ncbi:MAG: trigger factor [Gemmatimonadales bacterium]|nr:trigger factor [Gemmatimonadales bacterium]
MTQITVEKTAEDVASRRFKLVVPVARVRTAEDKALKYFATRARLPGFRPGKAPTAVLRKRFGDQIRQAVLEEVVREGWEVARDAHDLKPIAEPSVQNLKFDDGTDVEFDLLVEVRPELALERTEGFQLVRPAREVTDEQVSEQLDQLRERKAAWIPVEGEQPAPGQLVRVSAATLGDDGAPGEAKTYEVVLGQGGAAPGLEERIMTLRPGESGEAEVKAGDAPARRVRVTLHEVKRQELPALDDAFAREVGEFDTLDALRAAIREELAAEAARDADSQVRGQLLQQIAEVNQVPAPESLVHRVLHGLAHMYGVPKERLEAFEKEFHGVAEAQVRRDLIVATVAERHELYASEQEIDARVQEMAARRGVKAGELYASLEKAGRLRELEHAITEEKVLAHLLAKSTVTEATA